MLDIKGSSTFFDQCPLDPCVFPLRRVVAGKMCGRPTQSCGRPLGDRAHRRQPCCASRVAQGFSSRLLGRGGFTYLGSEIKCEADNVDAEAEALHRGQALHG